MKKKYNAIFPLVLVLLMYFIFSALYIGVSKYYYNRKTVEHLFDPFLQEHNPHLRSKYGIENEAGVFRVIAMGGSTTRNGTLGRSKRYPRVLQRLLRKHYNSDKIEVLNAGMDWFTTKHTLINYVTNCSDWKPNLVIVMHAINDLYRSFSPPDFAVGKYNEGWTHYYGPSINGAQAFPTFEEFMKKDYVDGFIDRVHSIENVEIDYPLSKYVSVKMFRRHLTKIVEYMKYDKTNLLLMTQPYMYKEKMSKEELQTLWFGVNYCSAKRGLAHRKYPTPGSLARAMEMFNKVVKEVARSNNVMLTDAEPLLPKNVGYFLDDVHYTKEGSHLLAEAAAKTIIKSGLIERHFEQGRQVF